MEGVSIKADSEFKGLITTKHTGDVLEVMDEVMDKLREVNPLLYRSALDKIASM